MGKSEINNLKPFTKENASAMGRKGGKASAKTRERHRVMAQSLRLVMDHYIKAPKDLEGVFPKELLRETTVQDVALLRIVRKAFEEGDVSAMTFIRNTMGEDPKDQFNEHRTTTFSYSERMDELERTRRRAVEVSFRLKGEAENYALHPRDVEYIDELVPILESSKNLLDLRESVRKGEEMIRALDDLHSSGELREIMEDVEDVEDGTAIQGVYIGAEDVSTLYRVLEGARSGKDVLGDLEALVSRVRRYREDVVVPEPERFSNEALGFYPLSEYEVELFTASAPYIIAHGMERTVLSWYREHGDGLVDSDMEGLLERLGGWEAFREYYIDTATEKGILSQVMAEAPDIPDGGEPLLVPPTGTTGESGRGTV